MNNILEYGNLIKRIRDGENLPEIAHYALDCLYKDGPIDTVVLEILSYMKILEGDRRERFETALSFVSDELEKGGWGR